MLVFWDNFGTIQAETGARLRTTYLASAKTKQGGSLGTTLGLRSEYWRNKPLSCGLHMAIFGFCSELRKEKCSNNGREGSAHSGRQASVQRALLGRGGFVVKLGPYLPENHQGRISQLSFQVLVIGRVTLIVPACQPGWEEMKNVRGNSRNFERKLFRMESAWGEAPQLKSPWSQADNKNEVQIEEK